MKPAKMQYKLHLTLRQRAALRTAISFWEKQEVKDKTMKFFSAYDELEYHEIHEEWSNLTKTVIEEWNRDLLPQKLEVELIDVIKIIGRTILDWYRYIKHEYGFESEGIYCIDEIHWTPYGTVDAVKTFKTYWLNNPNLDITKKYHFACTHMIDDHINDLWNKIPSDMKSHYNDDSFRSVSRHILAYWKCCRDEDLPNLMRYFEIAAENFNGQDMHEFNLIYDLDCSIEENMLRLSTYQGHFLAVKYFWERLTEEERNDSIVKCAQFTVMGHEGYNGRFVIAKDYKQSQYIEICLFFMNQMSEHHKKAFFNEDIIFWELEPHLTSPDVKDGILGMLLSEWPWQELFMPVLKDMLLYQDNDSIMLCHFLETITRIIFDNQLLVDSVDNCPYRSLLRKAWLIIPGSIKQKITPQNGPFNFITDLLEAWDLDSFKLICYDPEIATVRDQFIDWGFDVYRNLVLKDQFDKLDELDLHCRIPGEKHSFKNSIDHIQLCQNLISDKQYELLNKFLDWRFDTEEEKKKCKDHLKNDIFSSKRICSIWRRCNKNIKKAKNESIEFLHWLLESEKEVSLFRKGIIANLQSDRLYSVYMNDLKREGVKKDFLSWCLFDDEQVNE